MKTIIGYKFVTDKLKSREGNCRWTVGVWKKHRGKLKLCENGLHACRTPLQSLEFVYGNRWFVVESRGKLIEEKRKDCDKKFVCSEMRLVQELPIKPLLVEFSLRCAWHVLKNFEKEHPEDDRPRKALLAVKEYIANPTEKNRLKCESAAWSAAWSAARAAAESAGSAAGSAAASAAWSAARAARAAAESAASAARSAARTAAWSARSAWSAERKWQEKTLKEIIKQHLKKTMEDLRQYLERQLEQNPSHLEENHAIQEHYTKQREAIKQTLQILDKRTT